MTQQREPTGSLPNRRMVEEIRARWDDMEEALRRKLALTHAEWYSYISIFYSGAQSMFEIEREAPGKIAGLDDENDEFHQDLMAYLDEDWKKWIEAARARANDDPAYWNPSGNLPPMQPPERLDFIEANRYQLIPGRTKDPEYEVGEPCYQVLDAFNQVIATEATVREAIDAAIRKVTAIKLPEENDPAARAYRKPAE